ncbi:MAG: hypothetical protein K0R34_3707 [Herbinix sp.]|jgi:hypothetical protein|nr:hypothetical protein [Herbinix sp.]
MLAINSFAVGGIAAFKSKMLKEYKMVKLCKLERMC